MVIDFVTWLKTQHNDPRKWAVCGKGPSFKSAYECPDPSFRYFCLNDAAIMMGDRAHVAHFTDWEAYVRAGDLPRHTIVVMPWRPHEKNVVGRRTLMDWHRFDSGIGIRLASGTLLTYHSDRDKRDRRPGLTEIRVRKFSAVAAINLLGAGGVKKIWLSGIDGGKLYADCFDTSSLLTNGRKSFSDQNSEIERARIAYKLELNQLSEYLRHG